MRYVPAPRMWEDEAYENATGYRYYHWPELRSLFRTDASNMRFKEGENIEELTLHEFAALGVLYYGQKETVPHASYDNGMYYYIDSTETIFSSPDQITAAGQGVFELKYSEYIELSILNNQNQEETLL